MNKCFAAASLMVACFLLLPSCNEKAREDKAEHAFQTRNTNSFDKDKVELYSYQNRDEWKRDSIIPELVVDSQVAIPKEYFRERILLNGAQEKELDSILRKTACKDGSIRACIYEPRNAIVCYNAFGKVRGYIELCFHCNQWHLSGNQNGIDMCVDKLHALMPFMASAGIKYFRGD